MSARGKSYMWALAGALPATCIAVAISDSRAGFVLLAIAIAWQHIASSAAERAAQSSKVGLLRRQIRLLELDVIDAQSKAQEATAAAVVDLREDGTITRTAERRQTELLRRIQESRANARTDLHAEPTDAEIARAKADIRAAFDPWEVER